MGAGGGQCAGPEVPGAHSVGRRGEAASHKYPLRTPHAGDDRGKIVTSSTKFEDDFKRELCPWQWSWSAGPPQDCRLGRADPRSRWVTWRRRPGG